MNIYELFGLVLVIGMVVVLLIAARALGEHERAIERSTTQTAAWPAKRTTKETRTRTTKRTAKEPTAEEVQNSPA